MIRRTLTALAAALVLVVALPLAAHAAHVTQGPGYYNADPEGDWPARLKITSSLNYTPSQSFKVAESFSLAVSPDTRHNDRITCRNSVIDKVTVNMTNIGFVNPRAVTKECTTRGVVFYIDFKNQHIWNSGTVDRCTYATIEIHRWGGNLHMRTPTLCLPR